MTGSWRPLGARAALMMGLAWVACAFPSRAQEARDDERSLSRGADERGDAAPTGDSLDELFRAGNDLAFEGRCEGAIEAYGSLVDLGIRDADLEHNFGACYARLEDYPRAMYHFERALALRPDDDETREALTATQERLASLRAEREGEAELDQDTRFAESLVKGVSEASLAIALWIAVALTFVALAIRGRATRETTRIGATLAAIVLGTALVLLAGGLATKRRWLAEGEPAMILEESVPLHQSPDPRSPSLAEPARGGERGMAIDTYEGFVRVRIGARQGWVPEDAVGRL